jgi:hypothetical protein
MFPRIPSVPTSSNCQEKPMNGPSAKATRVGKLTRSPKQPPKQHQPVAAGISTSATIAAAVVGAPPNTV